ncbi:MAG: sensor histidine kinase [Anaerolineales bacterium]
MDENILWQHRDELIQKWVQALSPVSDYDERSVLAHITTLTENTITLLTADTLDYKEAQTIGQALSELMSRQIRGLRKTHEVLGEYVLQTAPEAAPRLFDVLCEISLGYHDFYIEEIQEDTASAKKMAYVTSSFVMAMAHRIRFAYKDMNEANRALQARLKYQGDEDVLAFAITMENSSQKMGSLLDELLEFGGQKSEVYELSLENFDLAVVLRKVDELVQRLGQNKNNVFEAKYDQNLGSMYADPAHVWHILYVLLVNAFKSTQNGSISLSVSRESADGEDIVVFLVRDTGAGIPPEDIPDLFEWPEIQPLRVLQIVSNEEPGLNLPICRYLCDLVGGSITVESEVGKGSTFCVILPAHCQPAKE